MQLQPSSLHDGRHDASVTTKVSHEVQGLLIDLVPDNQYQPRQRPLLLAPTTEQIGRDRRYSLLQLLMRLIVVNINISHPSF